eukprot:PLAT5116.1.p1 GENE.PLAT5116.1~~PLAT5116.1.p1  ORF type:complete len:599 (+),score=318.62 PLAT5116.1:50-1846(+)
MAEERTAPFAVLSCGQNDCREGGRPGGDALPQLGSTRLPAAVLAAGPPVQIAAGNQFSLLLAADGTLWATGDNSVAQCGLPLLLFKQLDKWAQVYLPDKAARPLALATAAGASHAVLRCEDGRVIGWGSNERGQLTSDGTLTVDEPRLLTCAALSRRHVTLVAVGFAHTLFHTRAAALFARGDNSYGQCGLPVASARLLTETVEVEQLAGVPLAGMACGKHHTVVIVARSGDVLACGRNNVGQLATAVEERAAHSDDGHRFAARVDLPAPATAVAAGYHHSAALLADGSLYSWGGNRFGQLGRSGATDKPAAMRCTAGAAVSWTALACGAHHTLALSADGRCFACGRNQLQQCAQADAAVVSKLTAMAAPAWSLSCVAAGFYHSLAMGFLHAGGKQAGVEAAVASAAAAAGVEGAAAKGAHVEALCCSGEGSVERSRADVAARLLRGSLAADLFALLTAAMPAVAADVVFIVEDKPLAAHRAIVGARCEPLARMLTGGMREASQTEIVLPERSYAAFAALLQWLYSDALAVPAAEVALLTQVAVMADEFLLARLLTAAASLLRCALSADNAAELLALADALSLHALADAARSVLGDDE